MMNQREKIRAEYSDILSLADVTRILKISKRKALWMLQNGYIESKNSGKKTRQYKIKIEALFEYMDKVERDDPSVQIPLGLFNTNKTFLSRTENSDVIFRAVLQPKSA